jgi:tetratricopeptide (TPR) repeat protein
LIDKRQLELLEGEESIKSEYAFVEKTYNPTSWTGANIPQGLLYLTNQRLFFFCYNYGSQIRKIRPYILKKALEEAISNTISNYVISENANILTKSMYELRIGKGTEYIIDKSFEYFKDKEKEINFIETLNHKDSFVFSVNQIRNCEFFNASIIDAKKNFIRITVGKDQLNGHLYNNNNNFNISQEDVDSICIYSTNPLNQQVKIDIQGWYKNIINVSLHIKCNSCSNNNYAGFDFCKYCGKPLEFNNFQTKTKKGAYLFYCGKYEQAIGFFNELLEKSPNDPYLWINKGFANLELDNEKEAAYCFKNSKIIGFQNIIDWISLGNCFITLNKLDDAIDCYEFFVKENSDDLEAVYLIANILYKAGKYDKAIEYYNKIWIFNRENIELLCMLGLSLRELGEYDTSLKHFDFLIEKSKDKHFFLYLKGTVYNKWGIYDEAIRWYNRALLIDENNLEYLQSKENAEYALKHEIKPKVKEIKKEYKICSNSKCELMNPINNNYCSDCGNKLEYSIS